MADWEIKAVSRDPTGSILAYCGDEPFGWTVWVHDLIDDIEGGRHTYYVSGPSGARVDVVASLTDEGKIVRTHPDAGPDLVSQLPRC
ncbi:MAG: hypothetical protein OXH38_07890 [Chloroflexi bacterium]|nr:hypothetical protein [Chloroflexota bacterium]